MVKKQVTQDTPTVDAKKVNPGNSSAGETAPAKEAAANTAIPKPEPRQPLSQSAASAPATKPAAPSTPAPKAAAPSTPAPSAPTAKPAAPNAPAAEATAPSTPAAKPAAPSAPAAEATAPSAPATKPAAPSTPAAKPAAASAPPPSPVTSRTAAGEAEKPSVTLATAQTQVPEVKAKSVGPEAKATPVQAPPAEAEKPEETPAAVAETVEPIILDTSSPVDAALEADRAAAAQFFGEPVEPTAEFKEPSTFEDIGPVVEVEALVGEATPMTEPHAAPPPEPEAYRYYPPPLENKYLNKEALRDRFWLRKAFMPIISYVGRLDFQKGVHLIRHAMFYALQNNAQFVLLGISPEPRINDEFWALKHQFNDNPDCHLELGFNEELSHLIYAGSDMIVMPSLYEPCGLTQMIALKYGAVPIVRSVGGLADTVFDRDYSDKPHHERNGYVFHQPDQQALESAMHRAIGLWYGYPNEFRQLMLNGMKYDYSWNHPGWHYSNIYEYIRCK